MDEWLTRQIKMLEERLAEGEDLIREQRIRIEALERLGADTTEGRNFFAILKQTQDDLYERHRAYLRELDRSG
jgi:hypothetical protein